MFYSLSQTTSSNTCELFPLGIFFFPIIIITFLEVVMLSALISLLVLKCSVTSATITDLCSCCGMSHKNVSGCFFLCVSTLKNMKTSLDKVNIQWSLVWFFYSCFYWLLSYIQTADHVSMSTVVKAKILHFSPNCQPPTLTEEQLHAIGCFFLLLTVM